MSADEFDANRRGVLASLMAGAAVWSAPAIATLASPAAAQSDAASSGGNPGDGESSGSNPDTGNSASGFSSGQGQGLGNRGAGALGKGQGVDNGRAFGN